MKNQALTSHLNLSRAYEVALVVGTGIKVFLDADYIEAMEDYPSLVEYYQGVPFGTEDGLIVTLSKPKQYSNFHFEGLGEIQDRAQKALAFDTNPSIENTSAISLLKTAQNRLNMSFYQIGKIEKIAKAIAQLDRSQEIKAQHVAEAIHYTIREDATVDVNQSKMLFGKGIEISLFEIDSVAVEEAISYLKTRL